ncbi:hypothetical protein SANTM175S_07244 [Streptomyces antimycoticus]
MPDSSVVRVDTLTGLVVGSRLSAPSAGTGYLDRGEARALRGEEAQGRGGDGHGCRGHRRAARRRPRGRRRTGGPRLPGRLHTGARQRRRRPVWPRPQSLRAHGPELALGDEATLIADGDADPYALDALRGLLHDAGVRTVNEATPGGKAPTRGLVVQVGGRGAADALRALRAPERGDLPSGGYLLATGPAEGQPTIALSGVGPDGLFHAVQTLRQLLVKREGKGSAVAGVTVRDWPGTAVRGTTEGFYGSPWSHRDRLAQRGVHGPYRAGPLATRPATSSGDETADLPASAAIDGKADTRWASRPEDGAWLQPELARPARIGRLELNWQDAYASRYRVQVSGDGRTWREAATVAHGKGGRESIGMDAPDTRFIRIQGVERATRFGYSLWSVAAYAVQKD